MEKMDDLDRRYTNYNPNQDYNGSIGKEIIDEIINRYKTIENYKTHLKLINLQHSSELVNKLNSDCISAKKPKQGDFKITEKDKEARDFYLKKIREKADKTIKEDK